MGMGTLCVVVTPRSRVAPVGTAYVSSDTVVTRHQQLLLALAAPVGTRDLKLWSSNVSGAGPHDWRWGQ